MSRCMDPTKDRYIPASYVSLPEGRFASSWLKKEFTMIESTKNHPTIFSPNKTAFYRLLKGGGGPQLSHHRPSARNVSFVGF